MFNKFPHECKLHYMTPYYIKIFSIAIAWDRGGSHDGNRCLANPFTANVSIV